MSATPALAARTVAPHRTPAGSRSASRPVRTAAGTVQAKLDVGAAGDSYEREADRVAATVTGTGPVPAATPPPVITGLTAQRVAAPAVPGPERVDDDGAPPEERAQRAPAGAAAVPAGAAAGPAGGTAPGQVDAAVQRMRGAPAPGLDPATRADMESRLGVDLGGVRVHSDLGAAEAAAAIGARAFTVGDDVFFGRGQYDPASGEGRRLLAHELVHTVQQSGGTARAQRGGTASAAPEVTRLADRDPRGWELDLAPSDGRQPELVLPALELPQLAGALKGVAGGGNIPLAAEGRALPVVGAEFRLDPVPQRPEGRAYQTWLEFAREQYADDVERRLTEEVGAQQDAAPVVRDGTPVYVLRRRAASAADARSLLVGTIPELARSDGLLRPMIGPRGGDAELHADHVLELQIGGRDAAENMWLLEGNYNITIGSRIKGSIVTSIGEALRDARTAADRAGQRQLVTRLAGLDATAVRRSWRLRFRTVRAGGFGRPTQTFWSRRSIEQGLHLEHFRALSERELTTQGFRFREGEVPAQVLVFPTQEGGRAIRFPVGRDRQLSPPPFFFSGVTVLGVTSFTPPTTEGQGGVLAVLSVQKTRRRRGTQLLEQSDARALEVRHEPRFGFGGYVTRESVRQAFGPGTTWTFQPLSPVTFPDPQITADGELAAEGAIASSKALLPGLSIPLLLRGEEILIAFPVPTEGLDVGPLRVTDAALEMGVGADGFFLGGSAGIAVDHVGSGRITARGTNDDVRLAGTFDLDVDFLDPAQVAVDYSLKDDALSASLTAGVPGGRLRGVQRGQVTIGMSRDGVTVEGTLVLGGVLAGGTVHVGYTPETGLVLAGEDIPLPLDRLPGVTNATVSVRGQRSPEDGMWSVSGSGTATLAAPGATGTFAIEYDGEAVTLTCRAQVARGPASGWLEVTGTNRALDEEGNPVEGGGVGDLTVFGRGEASIRFGEFLTGTAGLEYTPDGRTIVRGEIAVAPRDLFPRRPYQRTLLDLRPPEFPIWGVSIAGIGFGIFAFVDAQVRFVAWVGPGQLRDTSLRAEIDLDAPEAATVEGSARFVVPAYAGFTLDLGGGLRARAAVAFVQGRVGLEGSLGVAAEAAAAVDVRWNALEGLSVEAAFSANARPKFTLAAVASVTAGVDLYVGSITRTFGPWRRTLGEFGPDLELGVTFPARWSEEDGLDLDLDDIEVRQPQLDAAALMSDAFDTLV